MKDLSIWDLMIYFKTAAKDARAKAVINGYEIEVYYIDGDLHICGKENPTSLFEYFSHNIILNSRYTIVKDKNKELKGNWILCDNINEALDKYSEGYNIRLMIYDGGFHPSRDRYEIFEDSAFINIEDEVVNRCSKIPNGISLMFWGNWYYLEEE